MLRFVGIWGLEFENCLGLAVACAPGWNRTTDILFVREAL